MEDRKARTRAGGSSFLSREIQLKLRCVCNGERKKVEKRVEGRKKKRGYFPLFFFLFFSVGNTARDTQTPRVHARNYSPRCYGHILCIPAYTHTRDVLKPLYTGQPVWRTNCSAYTCHRRQGSQLRQWARVVGKGRRFFIRLETSPSNFVDKNCCKKRISLWKIMGEEKISRKFVLEKSFFFLSRYSSRFAVDF